MRLTLSLATLTLGFAAPARSQEPEPLWTLDLDSPSYGGGALGDIDGDGRLEIVFGTYYNDEHLYAVNAEDGSILWRHRSEGGPLDASVAIANLDDDDALEILAADSASGRMWCLDGAGEVEWSLQLPSGTDSPPAVADLEGDGVPEIVVGSMWKRDGEGNVTVYRASDQEAKWTRAVKGCVQSAPCLVDLDADGTLDVVVTTWRGTNAVHAFSGVDGESLWSFDTMADEDTAEAHFGMYHGVSAARDPQSQELRLAFGTCSSQRGTLFLLDAEGELLWKRVLGEYLFGPTAMADVRGDAAPEVIVSGATTRLFDLDGNELWQAPHGSARGPAIADVDGDGDLDLVIGGRGRRAVALDAASGDTLWTFDTTSGEHLYEGLDHGPLLADFDGDGRIDVFLVGGKGTSDDSRQENYGRAFALRLGEGTGSWSTFRGSPRRTGTAD